MTTGEKLVTVDSSTSLKKLVENSLVLTATGVHNQIDIIQGEQDRLGLYVEEKSQHFAEEQLSQYSQEKQGWPEPKPEIKLLSASVGSLIGFALTLIGFFIFQNLYDQRLNLGYQSLPLSRVVSSGDIFTKAQWWRPITALFIHADIAHFAGNFFLAVGLAAFLVRLMGPGLTWLGFLLSGALGNAINAYFYRHSPHLALGFSTAVFGAAGVWAGFNLVRAFQFKSNYFWRRAIAPMGAALAFLALWGASPQTDYMAHFWGGAVGFIYGAVISSTHAEKRLNPWVQTSLSIVVLSVVTLAWVVALS